MIQDMKHKGFTIVELVVVIAVIGILAGITVVGYGAWRDRAAKTEVMSDLRNAALAMKNELNFNNKYPTTMPDSYKVSPNVVVEMIQSPDTAYCINAYNKQKPAIYYSISSSQLGEIRNFLCTGVTSGSPIGGTVPAPPLGINIAPEFDQWKLGGTATYNATTKELTLGSSGTAESPAIRVKGATGSQLNGQFYSTLESANTSIKPNGGWHSSTYYFGSDGTTAVNNSGGYTGNGCANKVTLNVWSASANGACYFGLGPNVHYLKIFLLGSVNGYASSDLKIRQPSILLN